MDYSTIYRDQGSNPNRTSSSPTTTICDTTTTTLPPSDSNSPSTPQQHIQVKDASPRHAPKPEFVHRLQKTNDHERNNNSNSSRSSTYKIPISSVNVSSYQHSSQTTAKNNLDPNFVLSKITHHPYQREAESHPFNHVRKRSNEKCKDMSQNESRRSKKSSEHTTRHERNNITHDDGFHIKEFIAERHKQYSETPRNDSSHAFKFETMDMKQFMDEEDMTSYMSDEMRGFGSKSAVPEEVRLRINSRERQRMHDLNTALDSLRQVMPYSSGPAVKKLSKMSTLLLARNYIVMLTRSLEEMKRLVQELSTNARPKPIPTTPLLPDSAYVASILAATSHNPLAAATGLYLPPPPPPTGLHRMPPSIHCASSTGTPNCACVECQRKSLFAASAFLESKKSP